jgi:lipopolysaccharide transport system ATP-binding protein
MSDTMIKVEELGKKYVISHQAKGSYIAMRDIIALKAKTMLQKNILKPSKEEFWALKDVSFEIKKGEAVGIIGRNGAGKSTLLKILSRITEPTRGRIEINGRVASLLEVGTGFHPELTGRENIFLNGAILGMTRSEIRHKFDEIVDFSGIDQFLDTPVKRYSSGMYVRLAFAVAAHLEPEILVVDEVLAVGDAEFQRKCLGKMNEVGKSGRTVLFVSHNMSAIQQLCQKAILLKAGSVEAIGNTLSIIKEYNKYSDGEAYSEFSIDSNKTLQILKFCLLNKDGVIKSSFLFEEDIVFQLKLHVTDFNSNAVIGLSLLNNSNNRVFTIEKNINTLLENKIGEHTINLRFPSKFLLKGVYHISIAIHEPNVHMFEQIENIQFEISTNPAIFIKYGDGECGDIFLDYNWELSK